MIRPGKITAVTMTLLSDVKVTSKVSNSVIKCCLLRKYFYKTVIYLTLENLIGTLEKKSSLLTANKLYTNVFFFQFYIYSK